MDGSSCSNDMEELKAWYTQLNQNIAELEGELSEVSQILTEVYEEDQLSTLSQRMKGVHIDDGGSGSGSKSFYSAFEDEFITFVNNADLEALQRVKHIGGTMAKRIMEAREMSEFKDRDDLIRIGLTPKQVNTMLMNVTEQLVDTKDLLIL